MNKDITILKGNIDLIVIQVIFNVKCGQIDKFIWVIQYSVQGWKFGIITGGRVIFFFFLLIGHRYARNN